MKNEKGKYVVSGTIITEPTREELATLLPWILGADRTGGTTHELGEPPDRPKDEK